MSVGSHSVPNIINADARRHVRKGPVSIVPVKQVGLHLEKVRTAVNATFVINLLRRDRSSLRIQLEVSRREKFHALVASGLLSAFLFALGLAASPQLHARLHPDAGAPNHECAVTLIAAGNYDHADATPVFAAPQPAAQFEKIPALAPVWVATPFLGARIFEHAPPALS